MWWRRCRRIVDELQSVLPSDCPVRFTVLSVGAPPVLVRELETLAQRVLIAAVEVRRVAVLLRNSNVSVEVDHSGVALPSRP